MMFIRNSYSDGTAAKINRLIYLKPDSGDKKSVNA